MTEDDRGSKRLPAVVVGGRSEACSRRVVRMTARCPRCGYALPLGRWCGSCWEGRATPDLVRELVSIIEEGGSEMTTPTQAALGLLSRIDDRTAAPGLREVLRHADTRIRAAAVTSLGWSGGETDVAGIAARRTDAEGIVRRRARGALAELGGRPAADALAATAPAVPAGERGEVQAALAWLGDRRELQATRELAQQWIVGPQTYDGGRERQGWGPVYSLLRLGDRDDRERLVDDALDRLRQAPIEDPAQPWRSRELHVARQIAWQLLRELRTAGFEDEAARAQEVVDETIARRTARAQVGRPLRVVECEPLAERSVPRLALTEMLAAPPSARRPQAKFGGQPDWVDEPTWPLGADGEPMVFYGQLPLLAVDDRVAYVFIDVAADETWEPLSNGNALVVQPGAPPHLPAAPIATGPALFETVYEPDRYRQVRKRRRYERFIALQPGADPTDWTWPELPADTIPADDRRNWNKIGGTPAFLQGEPTLPPGDWRFAFQFSAGWAGQELADGAECYGFVDGQGRGAFLWQCH